MRPEELPLRPRSGRRRRPSTRLTTKKALMTSIHQGWFRRSGRGSRASLDLDAVRSRPCACSSAMRTTPAWSRRLTRARSSRLVPFDPDRRRSSPVAICAGLGVLPGELDLGGGALELELLDPLDGGAGEERPVADEREARAAWLGGGGDELRPSTGSARLAAGSSACSAGRSSAHGETATPKRSPSRAKNSSSSRRPAG